MENVVRFYETLTDIVEARHRDLKDFQENASSFKEVYPKAWTIILQLGEMQKRMGNPNNWDKRHPSLNGKSMLYYTLLHVRQFWYCELVKAGYVNGEYNFEP